jgi:WD40 repeat protein
VLRGGPPTGSYDWVVEWVADFDHWVRSLAWCSAGPITCADEGSALLWRGAQPLQIATDASSLVSLPDGRVAIGHLDGRVGFVESQEKAERFVEPVAPRHTSGDTPIGPVRFLAADKSGRCLSAATGPHHSDLTVWRDGRRLWTADAMSAHIDIWSIAVGAQRVYTGGGRDRSMAIWDLNDGELLNRIGSPGKEVVAILLGPHEQQWISCADCAEWTLWDADGFNPTALDPQHFGLCALPMPDGGALLAGSSCLLVFDWSGCCRGKAKLHSSARHMAWGADNELWLIARGSSSQSGLWRYSWRELENGLVR